MDTNKNRKADAYFTLEASYIIPIAIIAVPVTIGREEPRPSTWFNGYNEKFFYDRGVLYVPLYGKLAKPLALRWLLAHKNKPACWNIRRVDASSILLGACSPRM